MRISNGHDREPSPSLHGNLLVTSQIDFYDYHNNKTIDDGNSTTFLITLMKQIYYTEKKISIRGVI